MSDTNKLTISAYNENTQSYISNTPQQVSRTVKIWLNSSLNDLNKNVQILEIGTGFGHDAEYIEQLGYKVERSDVSVGFIDILKKQNQEVRLLNVLTDEINGKYDLIFANAVFHHFTHKEAEVASKNILKALNSGGRFAVSPRLSLNEGWSDEKLGVPRFFSNWKTSDLTKVITAAGFSRYIITDKKNQNNNWVHLIAYKN